MSSAPSKTFYFHAHANSLGGVLETPHKKVIPSQASVALSVVGGHATSRTEAFNCDEIVSCKAAHTRVTGGQAEGNGPWSTLVTSVVEGLNILETVHADRMVAQISVEHPSEKGKPTISLAGCHFDGLRIGGRAVTAKLNDKLLGVDSVERIEWSIFKETGKAQAGRIVKQAKTLPEAQWVLDRFEWMTKPGADECVLCSLIEGFEPQIPGRTFGHALEIPHFGKIFLGELLVCPSSIQLSMVRAELGCATKGQVGVGSLAIVLGTVFPS
jgi:hypothetical protein